MNTAKMEEGATVVVFGLGGIGLNVLQGCRMAKAKVIVGIDLNSDREEVAKKFGMTHFINPSNYEGNNLQEKIIELFSQSEKKDEPIAFDLKSNNPIFLKVGRYGPYLQCEKKMKSL